VENKRRANSEKQNTSRRGDKIFGFEDSQKMSAHPIEHNRKRCDVDYFVVMKLLREVE
jgi:hypothetical protein